MIEWMQKHKKWLIVTIWISTIAFVGAGFVGWGSYDYGKSDSTVAIVGNKEVPLKDLQNEYSNLYAQYQNMLGENFNQELAKQFKLEDAALQRVIQRYLILNYADDLGIIATDKEVAKELVKIDVFFKDGKFDKQTYLNILKQNRRTAVEFESQLKQDILVNKIQDFFQTSLQKNELKNISTLLFSENEVSIKVLSDNNITVNPTQEELQQFWEKNKENYKSPHSYEIAYTKIENIEDKTKKEMRKVALKSYLGLKKEEKEFDTNQIIFSASAFLNEENFKEVTQSEEGVVLKPLYQDEHYYVIKLIKKILPQTLAYEEVSQQVLSDYITQTKTSLLNEKAQKIEKNFSGINIGYITRNSTAKIPHLNDEERAEFIKNVFSATKQINTLNLGEKVIVYKITSSRLAPYDTTNDVTVNQIVGNLKTSSLSSTFLATLATKYEVKSFMGNK